MKFREIMKFNQNLKKGFIGVFMLICMGSATAEAQRSGSNAAAGRVNHAYEFTSSWEKIFPAKTSLSANENASAEKAISQLPYKYSKTPVEIKKGHLSLNEVKRIGKEDVVFSFTSPQTFNDFFNITSEMGGIGIDDAVLTLACEIVDSYGDRRPELYYDIYTALNSGKFVNINLKCKDMDIALLLSPDGGIANKDIQDEEIDFSTETVTEIQIVDDAVSQSSVNKGSSDEIYTMVEKSAEFPGGNAALGKWLSENVRYPQNAYENDIQGRVIVKFVIGKDGTVRDPKIEKSGMNRELDAEALRVAKLMPKWIPAKNNGVNVNSYYSMPVVFKLR